LWVAPERGHLPRHRNICEQSGDRPVDSWRYEADPEAVPDPPPRPAGRGTETETYNGVGIGGWPGMSSGAGCGSSGRGGPLSGSGSGKGGIGESATSFGSCLLFNGIEHNHWNLALGLLFIVGIGRPEFQGHGPKPGTLIAWGGPGLRLELFRPDLDLYRGIATRFLYQPGWSGAPPFEATMM
jgi:hypothetical protein